MQKPWDVLHGYSPEAESPVPAFSRTSLTRRGQDMLNAPAHNETREILETH